MSTEGFPTARRLVVVAVGLSALAVAAQAAEVNFRPVLTFGIFHAGNVQVIGNQPISDESAAIALNLSVDRTTSRSAFEFRYQPTYIWYRENEGLNYLGNLLEATYDYEVSRRSRMRASANLVRTDSQGVTTSAVDDPQTLVPRTTITRGSAVASGSIGAGQRSLVDWGVRAEIARFDQVEGVSFNNSTSGGVFGGWRSELNERTTLGVTVDVGWYGFQDTDDSFSQSVALTGTHGFDRETSMTFNVGATRSNTSGSADTGGTFLVLFSRELTGVSRLNAGVRKAITAGTGLAGTTDDTGGWVSYSHSSPRYGLSGAVDASYWLRGTTQTDSGPGSDTGTLSLAGALGWRFNRFLSLNAAYGYSYQRDRGDTSNALNTNYASYGMFLRWAIRGNSDPAEAGSRARTRR